MKRAVKYFLLVALALMLAGCASADNEVQVPTIGTDGKVLTDASGKVITTTNKFTDEAMYYQAQSQMALARKPILTMEAKAGETIELKGIKKMVVWGYAGDRGSLKTYEHPWAKTLREWGGLVGMFGGIWAGGYWANQLADTVGKHAGTTTTITDSYKTTGANSPLTTTGGGAANITTTDRHDTNNSYNDSHDTQDGD